ncbi:MAG TPA: M14 family metallopeptidase [Rhizomicrobium sp.]|nr:M14 family metallopeptidase [Rhizomicrobium sp.]
MTKPEDHFPSDYRSARAAFLEACEFSDLGVRTHVHPTAQGSDGKPLFLDVATVGPRKATAALLLISGTHGVEGYFGSGAQTGLLREGLAKRAFRKSKIVLLHALNPFGFSWNRRVNEDNADVNRNFVDHCNPPPNEAYDSLADAIAPNDLSDENLKAANARLSAYAREKGPFALQAAISSGQWRHDKGVYYGGAHDSWSARMLRDVFREELATVEQLTVIDFHTGLGDCGAAEMITEDIPGSAGYERAKSLWGESVASSEAGESISAPLKGTIDKAVSTWTAGKTLTFAALEVGTAPVREVFDALRRDNWLHAYAGMTHAQAQTIKRQIRDAFYPDTQDWKRRVWDHAAGAVERALVAIA